MVGIIKGGLNPQCLTDHSAAGSADSEDLFLSMMRTTAIRMMEMGSATTNGSRKDTMESGNRTLLPVRSLQIGRKILIPELMNSAKKRYVTVPPIMLANAAFLQGFLEYKAWKYAGSNAAAVIPMKTDVAFAMMSLGMR